MSHDVYLHSFQSVLPLYHGPQNEIADWTVSAHVRSQSFVSSNAESERLIPLLKKFCVSDKLISKRHYECGEVDQDWKNHEVYKVTEDSPYGSDIGVRNRFFEKKSRRVFQEFYDSGKVPDHLIHVSCTGYVAPSPAQIYFNSSNKVPAITHAYHMGCYASLPSVRMARALAQTTTVDIVHTEMCSLHLNLGNHSPEQMVVQTLFADGHIKYTAGLNHTGPAFKVLQIEERLVKDSLDDMTWIPGKYGMEMTLSREVPIKIQAGIHDFIQELCDKANLEVNKVKTEAIYAIHPGGPKIIDAIQSSLNLRDSQIISSRKILYERGNMSSATLPHVWQNVLERNEPKGTIVISLAFGPGLTMFGGIFEIA